MRRSFVLAVALASVVSTMPLRAHAATGCSGSTTEPIAACGSMTFSASSTAFALVNFPAGTVLDNKAISITGGGPFVGIVITPDPPYLGAPNCGKTQLGDEITLCPNPADSVYLRGLLSDAFVKPRYFVSLDDTFCSTCTLNGGRYRVYVVADGSPVTVSIAFPGLGGAVAVTPAHRVPSNIGLPDPSLLPSGSSVYGAGITAPIDSIAMQFGASAVWATPSLDDEAGICFYEGDPGDPRLAYEPACPSLTADSGIDMFSGYALPGSGGLLSYGMAYPFRSGTQGTGGWTAAAGSASKSVVLSVQIAFDHS